jgi:HAD superfamily hydrolase (TIGR01509 family)
VSRRALVFDLDGTLVDSHAYTFAAVRHALAPYGVRPTDAEIHSRFGPPERIILSTFVDADLVAPAYARLQDFYRRHADTLRVHPKLPPLLAAARAAGIGCGLFTGRGADSTRIVLAQAGLVSAFDAVVAGDDAVRPKPAPDGVLALSARLGCDPAQVLVVGDSPLDIEAARAAGAVALFATWFPLAQRPLPAGVDSVDDPDELRPWLGLTAPGS